jgi:hypothetical protein
LELVCLEFHTRPSLRWIPELLSNMPALGSLTLEVCRPDDRGLSYSADPQLLREVNAAIESFIMAQCPSIYLYLAL